MSIKRKVFGGCQPKVKPRHQTPRFPSLTRQSPRPIKGACLAGSIHSIPHSVRYIVPPAPPRALNEFVANQDVWRGFVQDMVECVGKRSCPDVLYNYVGRFDCNMVAPAGIRTRAAGKTYECLTNRAFPKVPLLKSN
jgi:hypothetical protein